MRCMNNFHKLHKPLFDRKLSYEYSILSLFSGRQIRNYTDVGYALMNLDRVQISVKYHFFPFNGLLHDRLSGSDARQGICQFQAFKIRHRRPSVV